MNISIPSNARKIKVFQENSQVLRYGNIFKNIPYPTEEWRWDVSVK